MIVDRRRFVAAAGMAGLAAALGAPMRRRFAYVTAPGDRVHPFVDSGDGWRAMDCVRSPGALGVAVSRDGRIVYVGNDVDRFDGRPGGSVETFAVGLTGRLRPVGRAGLALFGHAPERLAVSPHGRWLAVGLAGGGYNVLALGEDGLPGRVVSALRKIGGNGGGELMFAADDLLVNVIEGKTEALAVGVDGALSLMGRVPEARSLMPGGVMRGGVDVGLARAMALAGVEARGAAVGVWG